MGKSSTSKRREKAQDLMKDANRKERKREQTVRIVGGSVVGVVIIAIIGVAVVVSNTSKPPSINTAPDANAVVPSGVYTSENTYPFAVPVGDFNEEKPVLEIWADFQCPACGALEEFGGEHIQSLAEKKEINLIYRPTTFLDAGGATNSSKRAVAAWGCAIDEGKTLEYYNELFKNQPPEKAGWTDAELLQYGTNVGLNGESYENFKQCFTDLKYIPWAVNSTEEFYNNGIESTPTVLLNGAKLSNETAATAELLDAEIVKIK